MNKAIADELEKRMCTKEELEAIEKAKTDARIAKEIKYQKDKEDVIKMSITYQDLGMKFDAVAYMRALGHYTD